MDNAMVGSIILKKLTHSKEKTTAAPTYTRVKLCLLKVFGIGI